MYQLISIRGQFLRDDRGGVALVFAIALVALMIVMGLAVDTARYQNVASRMQQALDGASLAAAKMLADPGMSDSDIKERAQSYFDAAIQTFGIEVKSASPLAVAIDRTASSVQVNGKLEVPAYFGGFASLPSMRVLNQKSKVVYDITNIELAMVLDITGSMSTNGKLSDLKNAAKDVVDTLFDGALNDTNIRIALAPYSATVNAGALAPAVSLVPAADPCVMERTGAQAFTDALATGVNALPTIASFATPPSGYFCPASSVVPLTDRTGRDALKNAIDSYVADGGTAGHIGTAWGRYLLSPAWSSILPADSAPRAFNDAVRKTMIIMTDGEFNTAYTGGADAIAESYLYFDNLCAAAKADGVDVYTVGFDLNDPAALAHLESCASAPAQFYDAKTGSQLKDAFKDIADKLGNLRVAG